MNIIAPVFHPSARVSPAVEEMVRELMIGEFRPRPAPPKKKAPKVVAPRKGPVRNPVTIRGVHYPTESDAAKCLGVNRSVVRAAKERGQPYLDRVGLRRPNGSGVSTVVNGVTYPTLKAAADAYGITSSAMSGRIRRGTVSELLRGDV